MTIEVKAFTAMDGQAAAALHADCFADDPWPPEAFSALMASQSQGFAAWSGSEIIGLILVRPAMDEAEILTFAVAPGYRRQGLGRILLAHGMAALAAQSVTKLFLEVAEDNEAARLLYTESGFEVIATRTGYYHHSTEPKNALVMVCNLERFNEK
jgi:ribosomal-protein-alanine N-acetyltransferase